eukprot:Skav210710  [mRNA]  locus=scaffold1582:138841:140232:+ [translate_table: standard]
MIEPSLPVCQVEQIRSITNQTPRFYTDGSCQFPALPAGRYASFAIILDTAFSDEERVEQVERYHATGQLPQTLQLLAQGRVPGRQDIHRAELLALVLIVESFEQAVFHTDSQVAISALQLVREGAFGDLQKHPDFDLLCRLQHSLKPTHVVRKIKAHQTICLSMDPMEAYHVLGNQMANDTAIHTACHANDSFAHELQQRASELEATQLAYRKVLEYVVALQTARAQASQGEVFNLVSSSGPNLLDPSARFLSWNPHPCWSIQEQLDLRWLGACAWSEELAVAAISFLQDCAWPLEQEGHSSTVVGISWQEVALAIMFHFKEYIPVRRLTSTGTLELVRLPTFQSVQLHGATLSEMSNNVSLLFTQLKNLVPQELFPPLTRTRVKSMYLLGAPQFCQGLRQRPRHSFQEEVLTTAKLYLASGSLPNMGFCGSDGGFDITDWQLRSQRATEAIREVRYVSQADT